MKTWQGEKKILVYAIFCFILTLLLPAGMAYAHSKRQICFQNLLDKSTHWENSDPLPERSGRAEYLSPGLHKALLAKLAKSHWWQTHLQDPLPPPSVFTMQTNLCKYLDKWPTPGLTVSPDAPPNEELTDEDLM